MKNKTKRNYNKNKSKNKSKSKSKSKRQSYLVNKKYNCVRLTRKNINNKRYKGGGNIPQGGIPPATTPVPSNVTLPMIIDKNQIAYSCTPVPTS